jgi:hypothetical protein
MVWISIAGTVRLHTSMWRGMVARTWLKRGWPLVEEVLHLRGMKIVSLGVHLIRGLLLG